MPRIDSNWNLAGDFYLILFSGLGVFCLFAIVITMLFFKETRHNDEASRNESNSEHPKTHKNGIFKRISEYSLYYLYKTTFSSYFIFMKKKEIELIERFESLKSMSKSAEMWLLLPIVCLAGFGFSFVVAEISIVKIFYLVSF